MIPYMGRNHSGTYGHHLATVADILSYTSSADASSVLVGALKEHTITSHNFVLQYVLILGNTIIATSAS